MNNTTSITLLSDRAVSDIPVVESADKLVPWFNRATHTEHSLPHPLVREGLAIRLARAQSLLPPGVHLKVVEGFRPAHAQRAIIDMYEQSLRDEYPGIGADALRNLSSRFVSPIDVAPHVAGAAVDVTLVDQAGHEYDMGTAIDATPEQSGNACYFDAPVDAAARAARRVLARALTRAGLVNYPTEWWHWSYGDRYWALMTGAAHAIYGPVPDAAARAAAHGEESR